jgi:hypothetical protein
MDTVRKSSRELLPNPSEKNFWVWKERVEKELMLNTHSYTHGTSMRATLEA